MDRAEAYRREVEMLFRTWKEKNPLDGMDHQHGIFIRDGVVCPERWFSQTVRPLFLLKERGVSRRWRLGFDSGPSLD